MKHRVAVAVLVLACAVSAHASWYDDYDAGLRAARAGNWSEVVKRMTSAIAGNGIEGDKVRTYGALFINYHPYYYRGVAYTNLGKYDQAIADLEKTSGPGPYDMGSIEQLVKHAKASAGEPVVGAAPTSGRPPMPTSGAPPMPTSGAPPTPTSGAPPEPLTTATTPRPKTSRPVKKPPVAAIATATTATVPPSTTATAYPADVELTQFGNIAFNTPDRMTAGDHRVMQLLLDVEKTEQKLGAKITEPGSVNTARIRISTSVEARLTGADFDIRPITPELQAISGNESTEWKWEVTSNVPGTHRLFLTINAIVGTGASERKRSIRTFDRSIEVVVAPRPFPWWIVAVAVAILGLILAIVFLRPRRVAESRSEPSAAKAPSFASGEVIASRYRIIRLLGKGGMGAVYAAEDLEFGAEQIAVKTIIPTTEDREHALARFKREIQLARRVGHPNVCRVFDVGYHSSAEGERVIFVTMQLVPGVSLSSYIRSKGKLAEGEALPIVDDIAAALDATHRAGLIHRDVKSANVMLRDPDRRAILMDFGLAQTEREDPSHPTLTRSGAVVGSPMYMSPEQADGSELTPASDIYAFGTVIYEMVTGRLPFEGDTPMSVLVKRMREPATPPSRYTADLTPVWEETILRCLERDPAKRLQNASDVIRALRSSSDDVTQVM